MKIQSVFLNYSSQNKINFSQNINSETNKNTIKQNLYPTQANLLNYKYYQNKLNFLSFEGDNRNTRRVPDIDYFEYKSLSPTMKQILRKKCIEFNKDVKTNEHQRYVVDLLGYFLNIFYMLFSLQVLEHIYPYELDLRFCHIGTSFLKKLQIYNRLYRLSSIRQYLKTILDFCQDIRLVHLLDPYIDHIHQGILP